MLTRVEKIYVFVTVCMSIAFRSIISLHSYSGASTPPMYGDYEAQRHWQEITVNIPVSDWYINSTQNDLLYWGLDYPPLTAYHSYAIGSVAKAINNSYVELYSSRGFESMNHKTFMRSTVLFADIFVYIPSILSLVYSLHETFRNCDILSTLVIALFYPGQMLIDNGHFQYNNISLGLAAFAISMILKKRIFLASMFFALALNYKQMELYHALPFFFYLLRQCLLKTGLTQKIWHFIKIGGIVSIVFLLLWLPWIHSWNLVTKVLLRLFPVNRGVFEDKVANVWCAFNTIYKIKEKFSMEQMGWICLTTTLATALPINLHLFKDGKIDVFLYAMTNTAMSFFLTSYQVHEKSILLVTLPAICLYNFQNVQLFCFLELTTFSLLSLFLKDNLIIPYFAIVYIYYLCFQLSSFLSHKFVLPKKYYVVHIAIFVAAVVHTFAPAPQRLPHIWSLLTAILSCTGFSVFFCSNILNQFTWNLKFKTNKKIIK